MKITTNHPANRSINRDKVSGKLIELQNEFLKFSADSLDLEIPLKRITKITLGKTPSDPLFSSPNAIRAFFKGGGALSFVVDHWSPQTVVGRSENFGTLRFPTSSIRKIQFNPSSPITSKGILDRFKEDEWDFED